MPQPWIVGAVRTGSVAQAPPSVHPRYSTMDVLVKNVFGCTFFERGFSSTPSSARLEMGSRRSTGWRGNRVISCIVNDVRDSAAFVSRSKSIAAPAIAPMLRRRPAVRARRRWGKWGTCEEASRSATTRRRAPGELTSRARLAFFIRWPHRGNATSPSPGTRREFPSGDNAACKIRQLEAALGGDVVPPPASSGRAQSQCQPNARHPDIEPVVAAAASAGEYPSRIANRHLLFVGIVEMNSPCRSRSRPCARSGTSMRIAPVRHVRLPASPDQREAAIEQERHPRIGSRRRIVAGAIKRLKTVQHQLAAAVEHFNEARCRWSARRIMARMM